MTANLPITLDMAITFAVLIGVLALFVRDILPPHLTAMSAMAILLATQVIDLTATLALFGNSATIAIACMFVLSAALERTGVINLLDRMILDLAERRRILAIAAMMAAVVPFGSPLIGKTLNEVSFSSDKDYEILDLVRNDSGARNGFANLMQAVRGLRAPPPPVADPAKPRSALRDTPLQAGDRLIFKTNRAELLEIRESTGISFDVAAEGSGTTALSTRETTLAEGLIGPNSRFAGQTPAGLRPRRRHGSYVLAVHRDQRNITTNFDTFRLRYGDVLLLEGPQDEIDRLFAQEDLLPITQLTQRPVQRVKAMIATATILGVVGLAALRIMPIAGLAIPGAVLVILTGCVSLEKAYKAIERRILMLIFGMLGLSLAMEKSGAARLIVDTVADLVQDFGSVAVLAAVYATTSLLTELMSNNATAVLMTPIVIGVAQHTGLEPRPLVVAVMLGASASFATPIGYQPNTYVYNIGNYRFSDFLKIGVPMNLLIMVVATTLIPLFWPLTARP